MYFQYGHRVCDGVEIVEEDEETFEKAEQQFHGVNLFMKSDALVRQLDQSLSSAVNSSFKPACLS